MTFRVSLDTRQAMEAEASRSGRSLGQVAELWIEQARVLHSLGIGAPLSITAANRKRRAVAAEADQLQRHFDGFLD